MKKNESDSWRAKTIYNSGRNLRKYGSYALIASLMIGVAGAEKLAYKQAGGSSSKYFAESNNSGNLTGFKEAKNILKKAEFQGTAADTNTAIFEKISTESSVLMGNNLTMEISPRGGGVREDYRLHLKALGFGEETANETALNIDISPVKGEKSYQFEWERNFGRDKQPVNISFKRMHEVKIEEDIGNVTFYSPLYRFEKIKYLPDGRRIPEGMYAYHAVPSNGSEGSNIVSKDDMPAAINRSLESAWLYPKNIRPDKRTWGASVPGSVREAVVSGAYNAVAVRTDKISAADFEKAFEMIINGNGGEGGKAGSSQNNGNSNTNPADPGGSGNSGGNSGEVPRGGRGGDRGGR